MFPPVAKGPVWVSQLAETFDWDQSEREPLWRGLRSVASSEGLAFSFDPNHDPAAGNAMMAMPAIRKKRISKRERLKSLLTRTRLRSSGPKSHARGPTPTDHDCRRSEIWQTLLRGLSPSRSLAVLPRPSNYEIELFVTRLEERRVLNGDFGMLAGIADLAELQDQHNDTQLDVYAETLTADQLDSLYARADYQAQLDAFEADHWTDPMNMSAIIDSPVPHSGALGSNTSNQLSRSSAASSLVFSSRTFAEGEGVNAAPQFSSDSYTFSLNENSDFGTVVGTADASDVDSLNLTYSFTGGNAEGAFAIDADTGEISVVDQSVLDFETTPNFELTVQVQDDNATMPGTDTATVSINLLDLQTNVQIASTAGLESSGTLTFNVTATGDDINQAFDLGFSTSDGSAVEGATGIGASDYLGTDSGTISFAGDRVSESQSITIAINDDSIIESDETVFVSLLAATSNDVSVTTVTAAGTIQNDDTASLSIIDVVRTEGDIGSQEYVFTITSDSLASEDIDITVNTGDLLDAAAGVDYIALANQTTTIGAGETRTTVAVTVLGDTEAEVDETFSVNLSDGTFAGAVDASRVSFADAMGVGTVLNNDTVSLSVNDAQILESNSGATSLVFTISSDDIASRDLTVNVNTGDLVEALAGTDYTAIVNQAVTISAGSQSATIAVDVLGDQIVELDETLRLDISDVRFGAADDASRAVLGDSTGVGTITNDDFASITIDDTTVIEGDNPNSATIQFTISSGAVGSKDIDLTVNTADLLDAVSGQDYTAITDGTATIIAGTQTALLAVTVTGDQVVELDETLEVRLSQGRFNGIVDASRVGFGDAVGVGTITNDDSASITVSDVSEVEGDDGQKDFVFTVTSSAQSSKDISFNVSTSDIADAVGGSDYVSIVGQAAAISAGETSTAVIVSVIGDEQVELDEAFQLSLADVIFNGSTDATRVSIADGTAVGTIVNDDTARLSVSDASILEGDSGNQLLTFTISSDIASSLDIDFTINTAASGDAIAGADFVAAAGQSGTIAAASTSTTFGVEIIGDDLVELDETFSLVISDVLVGGAVDAGRAVILDSAGVGTILNDEVARLAIDDVSMTETDSGQLSYVFTITSDALASEDIAVAVNTADGIDAVAGVDYVALTAQTAVISAGTDQTTVAVTVNSDQIVELDETFDVRLSTSQFGGVADSTRVAFADTVGVGTIVNDDSTTVSVADVAQLEGDGAGGLVFNVTTAEVADRDITVVVNTSDLLEAVAGVDYTPVSNQTVTIAAGQSSATVSVGILGEDVVEIDETFSLDLSDVRFNGAVDAGRVTLDDSQAVGTITNDDQAKLSIADASIVEGDAGTSQLVFTITSSALSSRSIDFTFGTSDDSSALAGTDYTAYSGQAGSIAVGDTQTTFSVDIAGDELVEANETFLATVSGVLFGGQVDASRASIIDSSAIGTILNDDVASVSIDDVQMTEVDTGGQVNFVFTITSDAVASEDIEITVNTADLLDAVGGVDYTSIVNSTATIAAGTNSTTVTVVVSGDQIVELDETFEVRLSDAQFGGNANPAQVNLLDAIGIGTILNDDSTTLSIDDVAMVEGDSGTTDFVFTISSTFAAGRDISVQVDTADLLEAVAGTDYIAISNQDIVIAAGDTSASVTVSVAGDTVLEVNETFQVDLSDARFNGQTDVGRVTIADSAGLGTIVNDDGLTVSINDVSIAESDSGANANLVFTISSTATASRDIEVTVETADLVETLAGTDYVALAPTTAVINAGETSTTISVQVTGDDLVEIDETIAVNLSNASVDGVVVTIADAQGIGTIVNDDVAALSINDVSLQETDLGFNTYTFTITSDALASKDIDFVIDTQELLDATEGIDYAGIASQVARIDAGTNSTTVSVNVLGDQVVESDETFAVDLSGGNFGGVDNASQIAFADSRGVGTIVNDDSTTVRIDDVTLAEGDSGNTQFEFTIDIDAVAEKDIAVEVDTATLSEAVGGVDFLAIQDFDAVIVAGESSTSVVVQVIGEDVLELDETFNVDLTNVRFDNATDASRVTIADGTGVGTITNNDSVELSISDVTQNEGNAGTTDFVFTISTSAIASRNIEVDLQTLDIGDATAGVDFTASTIQDVRIDAGDLSTSFVVSVTGDQLVETDETFEVMMSNVRFNGAADLTLASIVDETAVGTIVNDDTALLTIDDLAINEGADGDTTNFGFTVTSSAVLSQDVTFVVNTSDLFDAAAGLDYTAIQSQTVTLLAGSTATAVNVSVAGDAIVELDETFTVDLSDARFAGSGDASRVQISEGTGVATIVNDDIARLSVDDLSINEGNAGEATDFTFTVSSTATSSRELEVTAITDNLFEAIAGDDYLAFSQPVVIAVGENTATFTVSVVGDDLAELDETFDVTLSAAQFDGAADVSRVVILDGTGIGEILNDDLISLAIDDVTNVESNAGVTNYQFTITADALGSKDVSVQVDTATLLDAVGGDDFTAIAASDVVIAAGSSEATVQVSVFGEDLVELDETFEVKLSNARFNGVASPGAVQIDRGTGIGTIINDDSLTLSINDLTLVEGTNAGTNAFSFTVESDFAAGRDIEFLANTTDLIEAVGGVDYASLNNQVIVLRAGETSTTVTVDVAAESVVEIDESFSVTISDLEFDGTLNVASRATILDETGIATIVNDDSTTLSIDNVSILEGDNGVTDFIFTVRSDAAASRVIDFTINTSDLDEAVAGTDYAAITNQTQRIEIGETEAQVVVSVVGDSDVELNETFEVTISDALLDGQTNLALLSISDSTGVGTVVNDDAASLSINDVRATEGDTGTKNFVFTVSTDSLASRDIQVQIDTADLVDAIAGVDYTAISATDIVIQAGTSSTEVSVEVIGDTVLEINETFSVQLSNARFNGVADTTRVLVGDDVGIGIIENDDGLTVSIDDVSLVEADSGDTTNFVFTITATDTSSKDIEITVNTSDFIGAVAGVDYTGIVSQTAIITAGETTTTVTVGVQGDDLVELDETFSVDLSNAQIDGSIVTIADTRGIGTILNDDLALLSVDDVSVLEGDSGIATLVFTVSTDQIASETISATVSSSSLSEALAGTDYAEITNQSIVIDAGQQTTTFEMNVLGDDLVEIDETFVVQLDDVRFDGSQAATRAGIADGIGVGTIANDDSVTLSIDDVTEVEADSGVVNYIFTITSDGLSSKDLSATVNVPDRVDSVGAPDLRAILDGTAVIAAGETMTTLVVEVFGDLVVEDDELFSVVLSDAAFEGSVDATRVTFADSTATGSILNNDSLSVSITDVAQNENETAFVFTIDSDAVASQDVSVVVDTADLFEAVAGVDYTAISSQTATVSAGETSTTITVTVSEDQIVEVDETFAVNISDVRFAGAVDLSRVGLADSTAVGTILNDDEASLVIDDVALVEGDTGVTRFDFTVTTNNQASKDIQFLANTSDLLESIAGTDYTALVSQPVTMLAGTSSVTVTVDVLTDTIVELNETFNVELSGVQFNGLADATRVSFGDATGLGTILNDDRASLSINDVAVNEGDGGDTLFVFTVSTDLVSSKDLSVTADTSALLEAVDGIDFTGVVGGNAVITAGSTSATFTVVVAGDQVVEVDETFTVSLSDAVFDSVTDSSRVVIGDDSGLGTIVNDDTAILSVNNIDLVETDSGFQDFVFTVESDLESSKDLGVLVNTNDLSDAVGGVDYEVLTNEPVVIAAGSRSTDFTVRIIGDEIVEIDETFTVDLSASTFDTQSDATRVEILDGQGLGTIINDDTAMLSIDDVTVVEGNSGSAALSFTISSDLLSSRDLGVVVNTNDLLEAVGGIDYEILDDVQAVITAGQQTTTVVVNAIGDQIVEIDETFTVDMSDVTFDSQTDATRAVILDSQGVGVITNDDTASIVIDDVVLGEGDSGQTVFEFTVVTDLLSSKDLQVTVDTNDLLEAVGGTDYKSIVATAAIITAGTDRTTVIVNVLGDEIVEVDETFTVDLSDARFDLATDASRVVVTDSVGVGTIVNDDTAMLSVSDVALVETDSGFQDFVFTVESDLESSKDLGVLVNTNDLSDAVGGVDYEILTNEAVVITAGTRSTDFTVRIIGDEIVEIDETFTVDLSASTFGTQSDATRVEISDGRGLGTIINDDTAMLSIDDVTVVEGNSGSAALSFTISSDLLSSRHLGVVVNTNDLLEAVGGTDYEILDDFQAVITAGQQTTTVVVNAIGDQIVEIDETFTVDMSDVTFDSQTDATRAVILDSQGVGVITNDDTASIVIDDVVLGEGDSGQTVFEFTVVTDLLSSKDLQVTVDTNDLLEAVGGTDYESIVATPAIITAGTDRTTVIVNVLGDEVVEVDETFTVDLSDARFDLATDASRVVVTDSVGVGTIVNDDTAMLSVNNIDLVETDSGFQDFVFTVESDLESSKDFGVLVDTNDLSDAVGGVDYEILTNESVVITAGTRSTDFTVRIIGDEIVEIDETFTVDLSASTFDTQSDATRVEILDGQGLGTIINDDTAMLSIDDVTVVEGDSGSAALSFTISSDLLSSRDLGVVVNTNDLLEAVGGTDYEILDDVQAVITAGQQTTTVVVNAIGDQIIEIDETFTVDMSDVTFDSQTDATRAVILDSQGVGVITNDDTASIVIDDVVLSEGDSGQTVFEFTVVTDLLSSKDLQVTVDTNDLLEAIGGTDYESVMATPAIITAGNDRTTVIVNVLGDEIVEVDETFTVDLSDARFDLATDASRVVVTDSVGVGTIVNDDTAMLSVNNIDLVETDSGFQDFVFTVESDLESSKDLGVLVNTNDLSDAVGGVDYEILTNEAVVITAGTRSTDFTVRIIGDEIVEIDETFTVDLSAATFDTQSDATRVEILDGQGLGTIINDDTAMLSIDDVTVVEGNSGSAALSFTISSGLLSSRDLGVVVNTNDLLEAVGGTDYEILDDVQAVITAGQQTTTVVVNAIGDQIVEIDETFTVDMSDVTFDSQTDATRAVILDSQGVGVITNDDTASIVIDDVVLSEGDSGRAVFEFTVVTDLLSSKDLQVTVDTNDLLEAVGGTDYQSIVATPAIITAGTDRTTVIVNVLGDEIVEVDETFTVDLSDARFDQATDATRVVVTDSVGVGTIVNDDTAMLSVSDVALVETDSGFQDFVFTVESDLESSKDLGVLVNTNELADAVGGVDYEILTNDAVVITAGSRSTDFTVRIIGDEIVEIDETFTVDLSAATFDTQSDATRVEILDSQGLGTIINDDTAMLSIDDVTVVEGNSGSAALSFTISSGLLSSRDLGVVVNTNDLLEAVGGTDYEILDDVQAVITAGQQTTTVVVNAIGDQIVEIDETFTVDMSDVTFDSQTDATRAVILDSQGVGVITNDDTASIVIDDVVLSEGDSGQTVFEFTVVTDLLSSKDLQVTVDTNDLLEAIGGTDYESIVATPAIITAGNDRTTVIVNVLGDEIVEVDETFTVDLSDARFDLATDASRVVVTDSVGVGTIVNDDTATLSVNNIDLVETDSGFQDFVFTVESDLESSKDLGVLVNTNDLSDAVGGVDYEILTNDAVVITAGTRSTDFSVRIIGDEIVEIDETFTVDLSASTFDTQSDATRVEILDGQGLGTIINDDTAMLSIDDVTVVEGNSGSAALSFTISSDLLSSRDLGVVVNTNDLLEAVGGTDYEILDDVQAVITAGQQTTTVVVNAIGDQIVEIDETFTVDMSDVTFDSQTDATRAVILDSQGVGVITNDDTASIVIDDVVLSEGDSGQTVFEFTVVTDLLSSKDLQVTVDTNDLLEAIGGTDYESIVATPAIITAGKDRTTVIVNVLGDEIVEVDETFTVDLSDARFDLATDPSRVVVTDSVGLGTIVNDDTAMLSVNNIDLVETDSGFQDFVFTVESDLESSKDLGVLVNTNDLSDAVGGVDYGILTNEAVVITAGSRSTDFTVRIIGDEIVEIDETFTVDLSASTFDTQSDATRVEILDGQGLGTIINDDVTSLSIDDVSVNEGDSGATSFTFTVSSELLSSKDLAVTLDTSDLFEAAAGIDYQPIDAQQLIIAAGTGMSTFTVSVNGDQLVEVDETFTVNLSEVLFDGVADSSRVVIADASGLGTILNDDTAELSIADVSVVETDEGVSVLTFQVQSSLLSSKGLSFDVQTSDLLEAAAGIDYVAINGQQFVINAGDDSVSIEVDIVGDEIVELDETFEISLSNERFDGASDSSRVIVNDGEAVGTIVNDDTALLSIADVAQVETDSGVTTFVFTVSSDLVSSKDFAVNVSTSSLVEAVDGLDYIAPVSQPAVISAGTTTTTIAVDVIGDEIVELDETFSVDISLARFDAAADASRVVIADSNAIGTIINDDLASLTVDDVSLVEGDTGETVITFVIASDHIASKDFAVQASTSDLLEAVAGTDYVALVNEQVVIAAGDDSATVDVRVVGDRIVELDETFTVDLSLATFDATADSTRVTIVDGSATGTIVNDDTAVLTIADVQVVEGDVGTADLVFTIESDLQSSKDLSVLVNTGDLLEAVAGVDYTSLSDQLVTIDAGENQATVTVSVLGDEIVEIDEAISLNLSSAQFDSSDDGTRVVINDDIAVGTIVNDDTASVTIDDVEIVEGDNGTTEVLFTVSSDLIASKDLAFIVNSLDQFEALAGTDYLAITGQTLTISAGASSTTFAVEVVGDEVVELDETFVVDLSDGRFDGLVDQTRLVVTDGQAVGTITNDDLASLSINDVQLSEGDSGTTDFVFSLTSDRIASKDIQVSLDVFDLENNFGGIDFSEIANQTVTLVAGDLSSEVVVAVSGDNLVETDEQFDVEISGSRFDGLVDSNRVTISDGQGTGVIINDDIAVLGINDVTVQEGDNGTRQVIFTVSMDNASSLDTSLTVRSVDGTDALVDIDYIGLPSQDLVIQAGQTSMTVSATIIADAIVETDETFQVALSDALFGESVDATRIAIGDDTGVATIINDDRAVVSIEDVTGIEGDTGITEFIFTVRQNALASRDTTVVVTTSDIADALAGVDYNDVNNQTVTILAGERSATFAVEVIGETLVEASESFRVDASNLLFNGQDDASRVSLGVSVATGLILNDDAGAFLIEDLEVNEGDGTAELVISISSPIDVDTTLKFSLEPNVDAANRDIVNTDLTNLDNQVTFRAGQSQSESIRFSINDDNLVEGTENYLGFFELVVREGDRDVATTVARSIDIVDNDRATFSVSDMSVSEDSNDVTLTVGLDTAIDIDATFDFEGASAGDFSLSESSVAFTAGDTTSQTFTVSFNDDNLVELDEIFSLQLVEATDLGSRDVDLSDTGDVAITDNDTATFSVETFQAREGGGPVSLVVSVDNPIDVDTNVSLLLPSTDDLTVTRSQVTFSAGSSQDQEFILEVVDDEIEELTERFEVQPVIAVTTNLGERSVITPEGAAVFTVIDNDTPEFLQELSEGILTTTVPILTPTSSSGGSGGGSAGSDAGGSGGSNAGGSATTGGSGGNQAPADSGADGPADASGGDAASGAQSVAGFALSSQQSSSNTSSSSSQSSSESDSESESDDSSSDQAKDDSDGTEFESDSGELFFQVVLPNGELGEKFELDIDLLNDESLFDRFRNLPTDVYRIVYREPGSDALQVLFEIYVVDGKIETISYSQDAMIEPIDPADDVDAKSEPLNGELPNEADNELAVPVESGASLSPNDIEIGRYSAPMIAATMALSRPARRNEDADGSSLRMDKASRAVRRMRERFKRSI